MSKSSVPVIFWIITAIAILWNLMGILNFLGTLYLTPEMLDMLEAETPGKKALHESSPSWLNIVFGIATIGGLIAAIFLLLRKKLAFPLFLISFVAVVIQMGYSMLATDAIEVMGMNEAVLLPLFVICISAFLVYYSRKSIANNWIS